MTSGHHLRGDRMEVAACDVGQRLPLLAPLFTPLLLVLLLLLELELISSG
jgi:hypothetical protein